MTLSFHKVMFSAEEVLDLMADIFLDMDVRPGQDDNLIKFENRFLDLAEERSRLPELQETWVKRNG